MERSGTQRDAAESLQTVADPVAAELEAALALVMLVVLLWPRTWWSPSWSRRRVLRRTARSARNRCAVDAAVTIAVNDEREAEVGGVGQPSADQRDKWPHWSQMTKHGASRYARIN